MTDALELGLVDEMGGLDKAIEYAAKAANLTDYSLKDYPQQESLMDMLLKGDIQEPYANALLKNKLGNNYKYIKTIENITKVDGVQALMPFIIVE